MNATQAQAHGSVGRLLASYAVKRGVSKNELARRTGLDRPRVTDILRGRSKDGSRALGVIARGGSVPPLVRIAAALSVPTEELASALARDIGLPDEPPPFVPSTPSSRVSAYERSPLRKLRELRGLSIIQLAERVKITDVTVWRWETGQVLPSSRKIMALSRALGVTATDLLHVLDGSLEVDEIAARPELASTDKGL